MLVIDPCFGSELRRLRVSRGLSLRGLAGVAYYGKSHLHDLEAGRKQPTLEAAGHLDQALDAGGQLAALVRDVPLSADAQDRLDHAVRYPQRADHRALDALEMLLAGQRRLEDSMGAAAVIAPVRTQLDLIGDLVSDSVDRLRPRLVGIAAQWAQYAGWLHIADNQPDLARLWLGQALEWATEAGCRDLVGTVLSFRAYSAEEQGRVGAMIGLTRSSIDQGDDVYVGQRAYERYQLARGLVRADDLASAIEALAAGDDLAQAAAEWSGDIPPWHYYRSPAFFRLEAGVVHMLLSQSRAGHAERAVELLTAGLAGLPSEARSADWAGTYLCHLAVAHVRSGDKRAATAAVGRAHEIGRASQSARLLARVSRVVSQHQLSTDS